MNTKVFSKKINIRTGNRKVMGVVREHYLRDDIPCQSELCFENCKSDKDQDKTRLPANVTHYLLPLEDVVKDYFEVLTAPELRGLIFLQTVVSGVHLQSLRHYRKVLALIRDESKASVFFPNEFSSKTFLTRQSSDSVQDFRANLAFKAANWYYEHLGGQKPVVIITEDQELVKRLASQRLEIFVLTLKDYLTRFWPNLPKLLETYESISESLASKATDNDDYTDYLKQEVIEAGLRQGRLCQGKLNVDKHSNQEAFVYQSNVDEKSEDSAIFIPGSLNRNRAMHGDVVVVQLLPRTEWRSKKNRLATPKDEEEEEAEEKWEKGSDVMPTGKVVGILERNWREVIATIPKQEAEAIAKKGAKRILVIPYDYRIPKIRILTSQAQKLAHERIVVRIDNWPVNSQYPNGHFVRSLGKIGDLETEMDGILFENGIAIAPFSQGILDEMPSPNWTPNDESNLGTRKDLRTSHMVMSIDPKGCEDVDDTLSVRRLNNGNLELGVHIADVTHFVKFNSLADLEARKRATTVYLADRRYDMLPSVLSSNICSLLGGVDRFAVSVLWELDPVTFKVISVWYGRTLIKSAYKLFYEAAQDIIDGRGAEEMKQVIPELSNFSGQGLQKRFRVLKDNLLLLSKIAKTIQDDREREGALRLESSEVQFEFEATDLNDIKPKQHLAVHETVAECMIFANHWVAKKIAKVFPHQSLLRRHPPPKKENFEELKKCAGSKGWRVEVWSNRALSDSLNQCNDPNDPIVNHLLRGLATYAMVQALYFSTGSVKEELWEHYGLALTHYTHFTSPIRRYADVIVHRLLLAAIEKPQSTAKDWFACENEDLPTVEALAQQPQAQLTNSELQELSLHINERNRSAQNAQRSSQILFQTLYFRGKTPDDPRCISEAVIFSIRSNGFLVFVPRYALKGPVYMQDSDKNVLYYKRKVGPVWAPGSLTQDDVSLSIQTEQGNQKYRLFDHITVTIQMVQSDAHPNKLQFYFLNKRSTQSQDETISLGNAEVNFLAEIRKAQAQSTEAASDMDVDEEQADQSKKGRKKPTMYEFFQNLKLSGVKEQV